MKIFAVDYNYPLYSNPYSALPHSDVPVLFMMPDTAVLNNNKPFFYPDYTSELTYEAELVVKISRLGRSIAEKFAYRYYNEIGIGVDLTACDLQRELITKGHPWEISKGFDFSAAVGEFISTEELSPEVLFYLNVNGETVQKGYSSQMICSIDHIISYISNFYTLRIGDLIFTGSPKPARLINRGDRVEGYIDDRKLLSFIVR